jgi:hypothetical protein
MPVIIPCVLNLLFFIPGVYFSVIKFHVAFDGIKIFMQLIDFHETQY